MKNNQTHLILGLLIVTMLTITGCNKPEQKVVRDPPISAENSPQPREVTVFNVSKENNFNFNVQGTIKSQNQVKIYTVASGQIKNIKVEEGQNIKKGQILFEIGGPNNTKHSLYDQLAIAQNALNGLTDTYNQTIDGNTLALKTAQLQYETAKDQFEGSKTDLEIIDQNIDTASENIDVLNDLLDLTQEKNSEGQDQIDELISKLEDAREVLYIQKQALAQKLTEISQSTLPDEERNKSIAEIKIQQAALEKQISEISAQIQTAENSLSTAEIGGEMAEDQLQMQINQAEGQMSVLEKTKESTTQKLGLSNYGSNSLNLALQGLVATKLKNSASLAQIQSQLNAAKINVEMLKNQVNNLTVLAPTDGIMGTINVHNGDTVSPQFALSEIINPDNFELKMAIDASNVKRINPSVPAEIMINGIYVKTPIKNIGLTADPITKLIPITIALPPNNIYVVNQNFDARITLSNFGNNKDSLYIPLDAVIIGTEEQYVYKFVNGQAKKQQIQIGEVNNDLIQVLNGLNEGDQIILEGAKNLIEGEEVSVSPSISRF
jgi:RND family efflux transporter MFP subunit